MGSFTDTLLSILSCGTHKRQRDSARPGQQQHQQAQPPPKVPTLLQPQPLPQPLSPPPPRTQVQYYGPARPTPGSRPMPPGVGYYPSPPPNTFGVGYSQAQSAAQFQQHHLEARDQHGPHRFEPADEWRITHGAEAPDEHGPHRFEPADVWRITQGVEAPREDVVRPTGAGIRGIK